MIASPASPVPSFIAVARVAATREWLSHRLNGFLLAHFGLAIAAGLLPSLTPGDGFIRGASWWLLHAVLYALSLSALLLGLSSAHAESEEFTWLLGQPAGVAPWLAGKSAALSLLVASAAALLLAPAVIGGAISRDLLLVGAGAAEVSVVCALLGLAIGCWVREGVRGLIVALAVWMALVFGTDLALLGCAGEPWVQAHPDAWVLPLMLDPLDAFRVGVLFVVQHAAFTGFTTGTLTAWWVAHARLWLFVVTSGWGTLCIGAAWLGARRRTDG